MPRIMINGCDLYYEEHGTGQHTILFLHGLFLSGRMFNQQMVALRDRFRCVFVDLRGQGQSSTPPDGYEPDSIARDILQFINVKKYSPCHIIGASIGGIVGMHMTLQHPENVTSLTLIGSTAEALTAQEKRRLKARALQIKLFGMPFQIPVLMRTLFSREFLADPAHKAVITHWRHELLKIGRQSASKVIAGLLHRKRLTDQLYKIRKPTLIIAGEHDIATSQDVINRLHNGISGSKLVMIPDAGHAVNIEKPQKVNQEINAFLLQVIDTINKHDDDQTRITRL